MGRGALEDGVIRPYVVAAFGGLATVVPLYLVQLATEYSFFARGGAVYFFLSSLRTPFFVIFVGSASFVVGRQSKRLVLAWASFAICLAGLYGLLYVWCDPRACYSPGIDGLEPLRSFALFLAEGSAAMAAGSYSRFGASRRLVLAGQGASFFAIAYYPVMFTVGGTRLLAPLSPFVVFAFLAALSFVYAVRTVDAGAGRSAGLVLPWAAFLVLAALSLGIAAQYAQDAVTSVAWMFGFVVAGSLLGVIGRARGRRVLRAGVSRWATAALIGLVVLSIVVVTPDAVSATAPGSGLGIYRFLTPVTAGGFNAEPNFVATGVAANFTFMGTDPSSIQADNYLAVGIGVHSSNCCVDGIDYGYRADVFLYHNGSEVFTANAWEVCDTILACGGHTWRYLMHFSSTRLSSSLDADFRLTIRWQGRSALWYYGTAGRELLLSNFSAPAQENSDFDVGWLGLPGNPSPGGYLLFQFGVTSAYPIGHGGWSVGVGCPSTLSGSKWGCVGFAEFFQGDISFWKAMWRWGENYPDVGGAVTGNGTATFHYSQDTVRDFQKAW